MTEPTKIEADATGQSDLAPKPQDHETESAQAPELAQTALNPQKYRKLKTRFQALKQVSHLSTKNSLQSACRPPAPDLGAPLPQIQRVGILQTANLTALMGSMGVERANGRNTPRPSNPVLLAGVPPSAIKLGRIKPASYPTHTRTQVSISPRPRASKRLLIFLGGAWRLAVGAALV